ncbi:MAG TPA: molybdopterin cofactor-binding domain-containing protein [Woeseiaceae bacterium]|nr:molybdopterin cofactor-binding domain-containing protein [Woeseiaceae bacterium]
MSVRRHTQLVGSRRERIDAPDKATGRIRFADDISLPRMLWCKLLRSHLPHAKILDIDVSRARAIEGVPLVLTGNDFPVTYGILPVSQDERALCRDKVRFVGDPVAAVIALDEATAEEAAGAIEVRYRPLPAVSDPLEALKRESPPLHDYAETGNIHKRLSYAFGDADAAIAGSAQVFEDTFFYQGSSHLALEQHAAVAEADARGRVTLWSSTQCPHYVHRALAKALELPASRIRVIACPNGGGFGGKTDVFNHEIVVAKAALELGRPVKICLTREEVFYCHRGRHPVLMKFRTGVDRDGKLTGMHLQTLLDGGAYGSYGVASAFYTGALQPVTYHLPRYAFDACRVFTNKPPCGPKRGHGTPQPRFGQEVQLDKIAGKLGKDPAELRLAMIERSGTLTANYLQIGTIGLAECIRRVVSRSGWKDKHGRLPPGRGVGLACGAYLSGAGHAIYWNKMPHSGVQLKLDRCGSVTIFCGATDVGQGSSDVLALLVAEILGIPTDDVRCVTGDTALTPVDLGSYSSRVTLMAGNAAIEAAERARDLLAGAAAARLGIPEERLGFADGRVFDVQDPDHGLPFPQAVVEAESRYGTLGTTGSYSPPPPAAKFRGGGVGPSPAYSYTAAVVDLEVDVVTGMIIVNRVWIAHDIGRALNRLSVEGQIVGCVHMGLGEALMEEQAFRRLPPKFSEALVHRCPSMLDYKTLTALEMPEVVTDLVEDPDPNGPFGAKEVGQGPLLPVAPAVANAVYDAIGVRVDEVPITPEKILRGLDLKAKGQEARVGPAGFPEIEWPEPWRVPPPWEGGDGRAVNEPDRKRAAKMHAMDRVAAT